MFSFRHIAVTSLAGVALSVGMIGCAPERPDMVPSTARMDLSGNGPEHFVAPDDGMVYVYDQPAQRLIWSGHVMKGQAVDVDTDKNEVMVGGLMVVNKLANPSNRKDVYFDPSPVMAVPPPPPAPAPVSTTPNGVTVTPNVTVQPANPNNGSVTVQPGVSVSPAQPSPNP